MEKQIHKVLKQINRQTESENSPKSLLGGSSGLLLYNLFYTLRCGKSGLENSVQSKIQLIAENSFEIRNGDLCTGQAGIKWFFTWLYKLNYLDESDWSIICSDNDKLATEAIEKINQGNYDFLHGALGIAYYLLYNPNYNDDIFFKRLFDGLIRLTKLNGKAPPFWDFVLHKQNLHTINLGLAHGLVSVLKFCIQCHKQNICKDEAGLLANQMVYCLLNFKNIDSTLCYFPSLIEDGKNEYPRSRLAWCYGDLIIAFVLYQYGKYFDNIVISNLALTILRDTTKRKLPADSFVQDAGFCHGSAGIGHIYNKIWHYTGEAIFKDACDYWIQDTICRVTDKNNLFGFKKYNPIAKLYQDEIYLLEGAAGIGLVLISYLTGDFSWDYCLMLND